MQLTLRFSSPTINQHGVSLCLSYACTILISWTIDDITLQFKLMYENTIQETATPNHTFSGLLYHGYDYSHTCASCSILRNAGTNSYAL